MLTTFSAYVLIPRFMTGRRVLCTGVAAVAPFPVRLRDEPSGYDGLSNRIIMCALHFVSHSKLRSHIERVKCTRCAAGSRQGDCHQKDAA